MRKFHTYFSIVSPAKVVLFIQPRPNTVAQQSFCTVHTTRCVFMLRRKQLTVIYKLLNREVERGRSLSLRIRLYVFGAYRKITQ